MNFHAGMNIRPGMECIYQLFGLNKWHQVSLLNVSFSFLTTLACKEGPHAYRFGSFEFQIILVMAWQQKATSQYLNERWLIDQCIYASLGFNELNRGSLWQADQVTLSHPIAMG